METDVETFLSPKSVRNSEHLASKDFLEEGLAGGIPMSMNVSRPSLYLWC